MKVKEQILTVIAIAILLAVGCNSPESETTGQEDSTARTAPPKMMMTTDIPEGIATPDKLETTIGTLTSFDGVPDKKTTQMVYDNLDLQRAT